MSVLSRRERTERIRRTNEEALLNATIRLLEEGSSYAALGIEQIVRYAGLSRPTFYAYFDDKRDLLLKLGQALDRDLMAAAEPWFNDDTVSSRDTIAAVLKIFQNHRAVARAASEAATYDEAAAEFWQAFHDHFLPGAKRRISAGNPGLADELVAARAHALIYMTERTLIEHNSRALASDAALIDQLAWLWETAAGG